MGVLIKPTPMGMMVPSRYQLKSLMNLELFSFDSLTL
jgi:hypothetical protein